MFPLRLSLFALLLLAVLGLSQEAEAAPEASIESIAPQIINLDMSIEEIDWRNESYIYENHDGFNTDNHTWTNNYTEPGDEWVLPNPVWNLSEGFAEQDADKGMIWGPSLNCDNDGTSSDDNSEFCMYHEGGSGSLFTENYDVSDLPYKTSLYLSHRYNYDYYTGYTSYNGGQVRISTDNGTSWEILTPSGGYPGSILNDAAYGNPLYGQEGFVHCGDCSGVSGSAIDNQDKWLTTRFELGDYFNSGHVKFQFIIGMYNYKDQGDGEHWYIDEIALSPSPATVAFMGNATDSSSNITTYNWNSSIDGDFGYEENTIFPLNDFDRLSLGNHTISFTAKNEEREWAEEDYSWILILKNPEIEWINLPDTLSNESSPLIEFKVTTIVNYTKACRLDGGEWYDCDLINNFINLTEGEHSFTVNATDEYGHYNSSYFNWKIDLPPPVAQEAEAGSVEIRLNDTDLTITEEDTTVESETDIELFIRVKGELRESESDLYVDSITINVFFRNDEDPREYIIGYPEYQPLCSNCSDPGYDEYRSLFRWTDERLTNYLGEIEIDVTMKNSLGDVVWDDSVSFEIVGKPEFVIRDISYDKNAALMGGSVTMSAKVWNYGNVESSAFVNFIVFNESVEPLNSTQISELPISSILGQVELSTVQTKTILDNYGIYQTWYVARWTWDKIQGDFFSEDTGNVVENISVYAVVSETGGMANGENVTTSSQFKIVKSESLFRDCVSGSYEVKLESSANSRDASGVDCASASNSIFNMSANEDGSGVWTILIIETDDTKYSVEAAHWYLLDVPGNTKTDAFASDV